MSPPPTFVIRQNDRKKKGAYWAGTRWSPHQKCAETFTAAEVELWLEHVRLFNVARPVRLIRRERPVVNELHLTICGKAGKTTIARLIVAALDRSGVKTTLKEDANDETIQEGLTVHIETR